MKTFHRYSLALLSLPSLFIILLGGTLGLACSNPETAQNSPETESHDDHDEGENTVVELSADAASRVEIRTGLVEERALAAELTTTGQVDFDQDRLAHVSPRVSGRVNRVEARLGQKVQRGQNLVEIDSIELGRAKAVFLQAKAREDFRRQSFERARDLFADRIASEQEMLEAEAELREAVASLHTARETLRLYGLSSPRIEALGYEDRAASLYSLRAPFDGTVVERHATLGEMVTPERNLFTLADLSRVWIWIDVYTRDLAGVHLGDLAEARVDTFPEKIFTGKVSYLSARVDADTRTVRARVDVENLEGRLRPGMFAKVRLLDPHAENSLDALEKSLVAPESAIYRQEGKVYLFVTAGEFRYERREVQPGREAGGFVEILEGIEPGQRVVVEGSFLLKSALAKESLGGHGH